MLIRKNNYFFTNIIKHFFLQKIELYIDWIVLNIHFLKHVDTINEKNMYL